MKIALALICKGSDSEAVFLERCLHDVSQHVDGIFLTSTYKYGEPHNTKVDEVGKKYKAHMSYFKWVNDFSAARNFNWSQVPKEYDYILWCDVDDTFIWLKNLRGTLEQNPEVDAWTMQYYYDRDQNNNPTVIHTKTQVVKNDGCVEWVNRIHEDFKETREMNVRYVNEIKRIHLATDAHADEGKKRNVVISKEELKDKPDDPRSYFNLGNAYIGTGNNKLARNAFLKFLRTSGSDQEKYIIYQRLANVEAKMGNKDKAVEYLLLSIGMFPEFPDSYNQIGYMYFDFGDLERAEKYLLLGLVTKPQYQRMIVYNPRDYDYNPMMALAKIYFRKNRPDLALPMLKGCLKIYPDDPKMKKMVEDMDKETQRLGKVVETIKHIETLGRDREKILYAINKLPEDLQSHPGICKIRNEYEVKTESSGKDIAYYCGETSFDWNPELFKVKGFGGSEEAVVNLSKEWAKAGYNVTVFNSCGIEPMVVDYGEVEGICHYCGMHHTVRFGGCVDEKAHGIKNKRAIVTYKPWWMFNARDKWDHLIMWRHPKLLDYDMNADNIYIDLHDVLSEGEFTEKRLKKIKKIMVKTNAHRVLFPNIPDEKFGIIPNGMDFVLFDQDVKKNPYMLINTSSPDRCMDVLPQLFKEVKKRVPQARLKWAYGFDNFDKWYAGDKRMMAWKEKTLKEMNEAGIENCGRLSQKECAKLYLEGSIMAYPSDFYEIDCISIKKAQACGCVPVTTDFAAFKESNISGVKVHTDRTIKDWSLPYQIGFGTKYKKAQKEWVNAVVKMLLNPKKVDTHMSDFGWPIISNRWAHEFNA